MEVFIGSELGEKNGTNVRLGEREGGGRGKEVERKGEVRERGGGKEGREIEE